MRHWTAIAASLLIPLALAACFMLPGKFESSLTLHADRSFVFAYKGEAYVHDQECASVGNVSDDAAGLPGADRCAESEAEREAKYRGLAAKLAQEAGYRAVDYRGNGRFDIDYAISGTLTHGFVFPYNQDIEIILPFFAVELRGKDIVRMRAPGFAGTDADDNTNRHLDGVFTLVTDAEIVGQNSGSTAAGGGSKTLRWKVSPATTEAPMAELKVAGL